MELFRHGFTRICVDPLASKFASLSLSETSNLSDLKPRKKNSANFMAYCAEPHDSERFILEPIYSGNSANLRHQIALIDASA
jgi:hypothetical protein